MKEKDEAINLLQNEYNTKIDIILTSYKNKKAKAKHQLDQNQELIDKLRQKLKEYNE